MSAIIPVVTIDGPAGSGKGTISTLLAARLGWHLLDSGALYRLVALHVLESGGGIDDPVLIAQAAGRMRMGFQLIDNVNRVFLEHREVTMAIRSEKISALTSKVAAIPEVRAVLLEQQRALRQAPGLVADGRDMGTVVFPDARLKIYLTASLAERARRRYKQLLDQEVDANFDSLLADLAQRDERDAERAVSPLKPAADAVVVDSSELSIEAVVDRLWELAAPLRV